VGISFIPAYCAPGAPPEAEELPPTVVAPWVRLDAGSEGAAWFLNGPAARNLARMLDWWNHCTKYAGTDQVGGAHL
jgi:hypothetical protein